MSIVTSGWSSFPVNTLKFLAFRRKVYQSNRKEEPGMLRIAIIGIGWAGTRQVEAIRELNRGITVECLVDNDEDHLRTKAEELGVQKSYTRIGEALADPDVDAVSICLPHRYHHDAAIAAAAAKKHILCEKPMAMNVEEATRMIDAAEEAGVKLYIAENLAYTPMSRFLREIVQAGRYTGEIISASVVNGFRGVPFGYPGRRAWLTKPEIGGTGAWMLQGIHSMAQLRFILGEVQTVYMREHHARSFDRSDVEGTMSGLLTMESGYQVAVVQSCEINLKKWNWTYAIHGDQGSITGSKEGCEIFSNDSKGQQLHLAYPKADLTDYALEMEAFADYVVKDIEGPTTGYSERLSLAIVQAGYESAQSGQPVELRTRFGEL